MTKTKDYKTTPHRWTEGELQAADARMEGFCLTCRAVKGGVEPDAEGYDLRRVRARRAWWEQARLRCAAPSKCLQGNL